MPRRAIPPHVRDAWQDRSIARLREGLAEATAAPVAALVFDAYGTLFDVRSVEAACATISLDPPAFVAHWRAKQLEYSWQRSLMGRYADFATVTAEALEQTLRRFRTHIDDEIFADLLDAWRTLAPFPEVRAALDALAPRPLAILSNGSPAMLDALLRHTRLTDRFAAVLSIDAAQTYPPDPRAYALATAALDLPAARILFVTANAWDAVGAKTFGFRVAWCNRLTLPFDPHGPAPDLEITTLAELANTLEEDVAG
ncbi:MAG: haloacid dehalogenase type II [Chloroflexia bacterium]